MDLLYLQWLSLVLFKKSLINRTVCVIIFSSINEGGFSVPKLDKSVEINAENVSSVLKEIWKEEGVTGEVIGKFIFTNQKDSSANNYLHNTLRRKTLTLAFIGKFLSFFGNKYKIYIVKQY